MERDEPGNESRGEGGGSSRGLSGLASYFSDLLPWKHVLIPDWPGNLTNLKKCLHCLGVPSCHDDLVGMNVVK